MPEPDRTVADLVNQHAGATDVLDRWGVAYWREGERPLAEVCEELGVEVAAMLDEIASAGEGAETLPRWDQRPLADLVEHLVERHHQPAVDVLLEMDQQLRRLGAGQSSTPDYRALRRAFDVFREEFVHHMQMEERVVFRMIRAQVSFVPRVPLRVMRTEHDLTMQHLAQLGSALAALGPSEEPEAVAAFSDALEGFGRALRVHTHLENNVLLPRAFAELDARLGGDP